jgi:3'(2'), 5'-bisphosphate nucleotidase
MLDILALQELSKKAALEAGKEILKIYHSADFGVEWKIDNSPLTLADKKGHETIVQFLENTGLPILSEEGKQISYEIRRTWEAYWLIDPLDGTKEFMKRNGEFTVNIALMQEGIPIMGVVYAPVLDTLYWGSLQFGAFKQEKYKEPILLPFIKSDRIHSIVASRSHISEETSTFINLYPAVKSVNMGSSLKFMLIAEGTAQIYPRFAPTMEWDTAASQAILEAAGGQVLTHKEGKRLKYNKESLVNEWFVAHASSLYL